MEKPIVAHMTGKMREKLVKTLNLLGSPIEGEILAAAHAAMRILAEENLDWDRVIVYSKPTTSGVDIHFYDESRNVSYADVVRTYNVHFGRRERKAWTPLAPKEMPDNWSLYLDRIKWAAKQNSISLSAFEVKFVRGVSECSRITDKQWGVIRRIYDRI